MASVFLSDEWFDAVDALIAKAGDLEIFVEADTAAGIQASLTGEIKVEGDLAKLVAMQMEEPSAKQKALAREIAAITR